MTRADRAVDALYADIRSRYGPCDPRANGYRYTGYFRREQEWVFDALVSEPGVVLDIACGSGLMLKPFATVTHPVVGIDFNATACAHAALNGIAVVRGDAFALPFADASIRQAVSCQFLNQQTGEACACLIGEIARVLEPGGRCVLVWRNHRALIHRVAHAILGAIDTLRGQPEFPMRDNPLDAIEAAAKAAGLVTLSREVVFPTFGWRMAPDEGWRALAFGASFLLVLGKGDA